MSWSIGETVNTVTVNKTCAKELFESQEKHGGDIWSSPEEVTCDGKLTFNPDHSEWMDFLGNGNNDELVRILQKHRVKGDICFGSLEGDNAGKFWGYRFDGEGGMKKLAGRVVYEEQHLPFLGQTIAITGTLTRMTRDQAAEMIRELGGEFSKSLSQKVTHLVVGEKPGSKFVKAQTPGRRIRALTEAQFISAAARKP